MYVQQLQQFVQLINPLSRNSDQHQFSPKDDHRLSREMVMRINKRSIKRKWFDFLSNSLYLFFTEVYRDQFGEFVCGYQGLKG